ncbi:MAG: epimerase [Candidatus Hydrogenedentota bacterium]
MTRFTVTGGAGFIGSNLVEAILERGGTVVVLDDCSTGRLENISHLNGDLTVMQGSITDPILCARACKDADYVLHEAALPSVPRSVSDPVASNQANVVGTLNVLVAARDAGVKRVVLASSSSVYGDTPVLPKSEDLPLNPLSPYAITKAAAEMYASTFFRLYGLETISLRYFNVFGPRQDPGSAYAAAIPKFILAMREGRSPIVFGDGTQSRDFTYVDNVVHANLRACEAPIEAAGCVYNVGCGGGITVNELVETLQKLTGAGMPIEYRAPRLGEVMHSMASIEKARRALGYQPPVDLQEGLRRTVAWYGDHAL